MDLIDLISKAHGFSASWPKSSDGSTITSKTISNSTKMLIYNLITEAGKNWTINGFGEALCELYEQKLLEFTSGEPALNISVTEAVAIVTNDDTRFMKALMITWLLDRSSILQPEDHQRAAATAVANLKDRILEAAKENLPEILGLVS
jgi:hypothetical protein